jgi:predicted transcriptional regulator
MGHTKTAISLPDDLFQQLQASAEAEGTTRSAIVAQALQSHFDRVSATDFIARMNEAWSDEGLTEEERREEQALHTARRRAASRVSAMLREGETEPW